MPKAAPSKSTTYGSRNKKPISYKETTPSLSDIEDSPGNSMEGKLLEECDGPTPAPKAKAPTKAKPLVKKAITKPITPASASKKEVPSLPSSDKVVSKPKPKSALTKEVKPLPKAKIPAKGHDSDSDFDTDAEEEKVKSKELEKKKKDQPKARPTRGKVDTSKLPSSEDSSTRSTQSKTSSTTREPVTKKEDVFTAPSLPSPPPPARDDEDESDFGPDINSDMVDAVEKDLVEKGFSSPVNGKKGKEPSPIPEDPSAEPVAGGEVDEEQEEESTRAKSQSKSKSVSISPPLSDIDDDDIPDTSDTKIGSDEAKMGSDEEDEGAIEDAPDPIDEEMSDEGEDDITQTPKPALRNPLPRSEKKQALKRLAEYDSNAVANSEGGTAGLLLEEMSPVKKPRLSTSTASTKPVKVDDKAINKATARSPTKSTPKTQREKKTAVPVEVLSPIDYVAMVTEAGYGKFVIQKLIAKKSEQEKKCDWYELSIDLKEEGVRRMVNVKGKKAEKGKEVISGNDLHDLFHDIVLPALKAGQPLWIDGADDCSSPESEMIKTPEGDDDDMDDEPEYESEEEESEPKSTRARGAAKRA